MSARTLPDTRFSGAGTEQPRFGCRIHLATTLRRSTSAQSSAEENCPVVATVLSCTPERARRRSTVEFAEAVLGSRPR